MSDVTDEVTDLLRHLIRNACVNDGTAGSGGEARSAELLKSYLSVPGLELESYEPLPGRESLVARIEGSDPHAPSLLLMGHTDVVPVNPAGWRHDPFGAELVDGEVWGRGAVDMLNLTSSMAVAVRKLAEAGFRPRGTLVYLAVADEEALGIHGAKWLADNHPDAVVCDYVITEAGGFMLPSPGGPKLPVVVAEKGTYWCRLRIRGTSGHASLPFHTDNALVNAAEVVRRLAQHRPDVRIHETWRRFVEGMDYPEELTHALLNPALVEGTCESMPIGMARQTHACTHTTIAPTVVHGGVKTNVIPDLVEVDVDIRTLPGQDSADIQSMLRDVLGDLADRVEIVNQSDDPSTASSVDTPLWATFEKAASRLRPDGHIVPMMISGATDARFFRRLGSTAYGFGLFSERIGFDQYVSMFHGDNERVDQESLRLSSELWGFVARDLLER